MERPRRQRPCGCFLQLQCVEPLENVVKIVKFLFLSYFTPQYVVEKFEILTLCSQKFSFVGKLPSLPNKESSHISCLCLIIHTIQHLLARSSFLLTSLVKKSVRRHFDLHKENIASPPWPPLPSGRQTWRRSTCRTWRSRSSAATASPCGPPGFGEILFCLTISLIDSAHIEAT